MWHVGRRDPGLARPWAPVSVPGQRPRSGWAHLPRRSSAGSSRRLPQEASCPPGPSAGTGGTRCSGPWCRRIVKPGLCGAAMNQKKKRYFDSVTYCGRFYFCRVVVKEATGSSSLETPKPPRPVLWPWDGREQLTAQRRDPLSNRMKSPQASTSSSVGSSHPWTWEVAPGGSWGGHLTCPSPVEEVGGGGGLRSGAEKGLATPPLLFLYFKSSVPPASCVLGEPEV